MSVAIASDLRKFGIGTLMLMMSSVAISIALDRLGGPVVYGLTTSCSLFWLAMVGSACSDFLDHRNVNERSGISLVLNCISVIILPVSLIAWLGLCFFWIFGVLVGLIGGLP